MAALTFGFQRFDVVTLVILDNNIPQLTFAAKKSQEKALKLMVTVNSANDWYYKK
jgi:hypothetical protein